MKTETPPLAATTAFSCDVCGARLDRAHLEHAPDGSHCAFCGAPQLRDRVDASGPGPRGGSLDIGDTLHDARLTRGETLEQAARFTRIQPTYLRALEHDDASVFEPFPGMTYARFFLRDYAEHLGIDPDPLVRRFDTEVESPVVEPVGRQRGGRTPHPRRWAVGATFLLIAVLVVSAVWSQSSWLVPTVGAPPAPTRPGRYVATGPGGGRAGVDLSAAHAFADHLWVSARTTDAPSWVSATVDGAVATAKTLPPGTTVRWRADRTLSLRLGNAGAVIVTVNGRRVATGSRGAVTDLAFALRNGAVVRR
jgi:cytoskeleton protein RodZ